MGTRTEHPPRSQGLVSQIAATLALAASMWCGSSATTRADGNVIRDALESLVPYDLEGKRTFEAIEQISTRVASEPDAKTKRGLTFVRAVALTDLWILSTKTSNPAPLEQLAHTLNVPVSEIPRTLLASLNQVKNDPFVADIVRDSRAALLLSWPQATERATWTPVGPRTSMLYVDAVAAAFNPEGNPLTQLPAMADDPCPDQAKCGEVYRTFDAHGRKAIRAVETALEALKTLRDDGMVRDPFVQSIAARIEANAALLPGLEFAPSISIDKAAERVHVTTQGTPASPDIVAFVAPGKLEFGFVPRVRVTADGVKLVAAGEPMLPATREVSMGNSFPLIVRSVDELVAALDPVHTQAPGARIAIAAQPNSPAHLWARVLLSAKSAGFERIAMLGVGQDGLLRTLDVDVVSSMKAADVGPMDLNVMVRLGGFTVTRTGPSVSLPRLKDERGWFFDYAGLASSAHPEQAKSAKLTFMSDVAADTLAETAFTVAPKNSPLTVILP